MKFKRVYHDCRFWEEIPANMWGEATNPAYAFEQAVAFTADHKLYGEYMMRVIREWPVSCENALTDYSLNRRAWVGHAAVAMALNIPEDITRKAWGMLTDEQQLLANREAERAIQYWENAYAQDKGLCEHMALSMLQF